MKPVLPLTNPAPRSGTLSWLHILLLSIAVIFLGLHFLHLNADFPNNSAWMDWSKYTDEGWYGDAAIRHYLFGQWYFPGDFNPAVALPMWPLVELVAFRFTGVSPAAARALTLVVFAATLFVFYFLLERFAGTEGGERATSAAAPLAVAMLCLSPFFYVFERMAILEPLLIALTGSALLLASHLHPSAFRGRPFKSCLRDALPSLALGVVLPAMVLTKTTAVFLMPAVGYMIWWRAGYRMRTAIKLAAGPALMAAAIWLAYLLLFVKPHYLADYRYLFSANGYTGIELEPYSKVILNTIGDGMWMGRVLYPAFFLVVALTIFWRPQMFRNPVVPCLLLWAGGYFAFLAYHNNLQPRYYLVPAAPVTLLVALGIDRLRLGGSARTRALGSAAAVVVALAIMIPDAVMQLHFVTHPEYTFEDAANGIRKIVLGEGNHSHLVLSISGSDITLFTGLPSIDDDFGTLDLDERVKQYRPGWYAAWNELDDDKMTALTEVDRVTRVAAFPAMDDPERNLLILYRLDPAEQPATGQTAAEQAPRVKKRIPKPLITKLGQQPDTQQLKH